MFEEYEEELNEDYIDELMRRLDQQIESLVENDDRKSGLDEEELML